LSGSVNMIPRKIGSVVEPVWTSVLHIITGGRNFTTHLLYWFVIVTLCLLYLNSYNDRVRLREEVAIRDRTLVVTVRIMQNHISLIEENYDRLELQRDRILGLLADTRLGPLVETLED
jgi:hypothetical protein